MKDRPDLESSLEFHTQLPKIQTPANFNIIRIAHLLQVTLKQSDQQTIGPINAKISLNEF